MVLNRVADFVERNKQRTLRRMSVNLSQSRDSQYRGCPIQRHHQVEMRAMRNILVTGVRDRRDALRFLRPTGRRLPGRHRLLAQKFTVPGITLPLLGWPKIRNLLKPVR